MVSPLRFHLVSTMQAMIAFDRLFLPHEFAEHDGLPYKPFAHATAVAAERVEKNAVAVNMLGAHETEAAWRKEYFPCCKTAVVLPATVGAKLQAWLVLQRL